MPFSVAPLDDSPAHCAAVRELLRHACVFDRAADVAIEKCWGAAPGGDAATFGAHDGGELVGVAAASKDRLRILAVAPHARGRGIGSALLTAAEQALTDSGATRVRTLDLPGNYLAPGIDVRNREAIAWLGKRGYVAGATLNENLLIDVVNNPLVTAARADEAADKLRAAGYEIRRVRADEQGLTDAVASEFGGAWPFELRRAMAQEIVGIHVAIDRQHGAYAGFAAHDGNNAGLGWFGPAGTWPAHRGRGLGEALLLACLLDVAASHAQCEVAWIGPREFYRRVAGIASERQFVVMTKLVGAK